MKTILLDVFALLHRAYHALPKLTTPAGEPIGAVYGLASLVLKVLKELKPDLVLAAFDLPQPTFRHQEYAQYQATRPAMAEDLAAQIDKVKELFSSLNISSYAVPGYEADDVIGSLAEKLKKRAGQEIIILTGDLDSLQLIAPGVKIYALKKGVREMDFYDGDAFRKRFKFNPEFLPDYKGLVGDTSDNIPGVPGIGPKTAQKLIVRFGPLEKLYQRLEAAEAKDIPEAIQKKLLAFKEQALLSKNLDTIRRHLDFEVEELTPAISPPAISEKTKILFSRWGFKTLLSRLEKQGELSFGRQP